MARRVRESARPEAWARARPARSFISAASRASGLGAVGAQGGEAWAAADITSGLASASIAERASSDRDASPGAQGRRRRGANPRMRIGLGDEKRGELRGVPRVGQPRDRGGAPGRIGRGEIGLAPGPAGQDCRREDRGGETLHRFEPRPPGRPRPPCPPLAFAGGGPLLGATPIPRAGRASRSARGMAPASVRAPGAGSGAPWP